MININAIMNNDDWSSFEFKKISDDILDIKSVYFLMNDNELLYVGQTKQLKKRIQQHQIAKNPQIFIGDKKLLDDEFNGLFFMEIEDDLERRIIELCYIFKYQPKMNGWI